jgi:hypothetical protein
MRKALILALGAALSMALVGHSASADTTTAKQEELVIPDALGTGTADQHHSIDLGAGTIHLDTTATETALTGMFVPGTPMGLGATSAANSARVVKVLQLQGPGTWTVTAAFSGLTPSASASIAPPSLPMRPDLLQDALSYVAAGLNLTLASCMGVFCPETDHAFDSRYVAHSAASSGPLPTLSSTSITLKVMTLTTEVVFLTVDAGLYAGSTVRGAGTASSAVDGGVPTITVVQS